MAGTRVFGMYHDLATLWRMHQPLGADAIVGFRFATSEVAKNAAEVVAYGTAIKMVKLDS